ncbi:DUF748 domain-containing protein [Microbulbifer sp. HZ11]|uniref:DUF748 domain-containing protein n=1 Tax=Microbulbifer sp. HZ11 TaxID=1453501 RepID=UPI0009DEF3B3|nr:DUF748 domain-containing protein [Microbulbifer sp. HZ11]
MSNSPHDLPPVSPARDAQRRGVHRVMWILVAILLVITGINFFLSIYLPGKVQRWLHQHGLEAQIQHIDVSLPRLHAHLQGVEVRNQYERGFRVREATLGLSWWHLLRGNIHVKLVELDGAYMDLESTPGKRGRVWEIGGWHLAEGDKKPKNWRVDLTAATLRDSVVCYQHKPQWTSPSCVRIGKLVLDDFFVSGFREASEALKFDIGAADLRVENLLAWDEFANNVSRYGLSRRVQEAGEGDMRKSPEENPTLALVALRSQHIHFARPGNALRTEELFAHKFAGCPPDRWAEAIPALKRIAGHCGIARRLELRGSALFTFGAKSEIAWHRLSGEEVRLRYRNRRYPNWYTQTIALNSFDFQRQDKSLGWESGGASGFSWCPNAWREDAHHYCVRAGVLNLPRATEFRWRNGFAVDLVEASLSEGRLVDMATKVQDARALTLNQLRLGSLQYRNDTRQLGLYQAQLDVANGCLPGGLLGTANHCIHLSQLQMAEGFSVQFPRSLASGGRPAQTWALLSDALSLQSFRIAGTQSGSADSARTLQPDHRLELAELEWARLNLVPGEREFLAEDFALKSLSGCMPEGVLPQRLSPLCGRMNALEGKGNFILRSKASDTDTASPYLILGELALQSLLLSDHLIGNANRQTGLALTGLRIGPGLFRRSNAQRNPGEYFATGQGHWWVMEEDGVALEGEVSEAVSGEKGQLVSGSTDAGSRSEGAAATAGKAGAAIGSPIQFSSTELELDAVSLERLDGCLPMAWQRILTPGSGVRRAACFDIHNLKQQQPLHLQLERQRSVTAQNTPPSSAFRFGMRAAELRLDSAEINTATGESLLSVTQLHLPKANLKYQSAPTMAQLDVPGAALDSADFCLQEARCVQIETLRTGETFMLDYRRAHFRADLNQLELARFSLTGGQNELTAEVRDLAGLSLEIDLPRGRAASADWQLDSLHATRLDLCWPTTGDSNAMWPRCIRGRDLSSDGTGLAIQQLALHASLPMSTPAERTDQRPQLEFGQLRIGGIGMVQPAPGQPVMLNLRNVQLESLSGCGPEAWLVAARLRGESRGRWGGCLALEKLHLTGDNRIALGLGEQNTAADILDLGPLQADNLKLLSPADQTPKLQLARLQWQSLRWPGGKRLQAEDLVADDFSGCIPDIQGVVDLNRAPPCVNIGKVQISGNQRLALEHEDGDKSQQAFRSTGQIAVEDFVFLEGNRERMGFSSLDVHGLVLSPHAFSLRDGDMTGIRGCLKPVHWDEQALTPCFDIEKVTVASEHRVILSRFGSGIPQRYFRNIQVDGLRVFHGRGNGEVVGSSAPYLQAETLRADELGFGSRQLVAENLQIRDIQGCVPPGYIPGVRYCLDLQSLETTGVFDFDAQSLQLEIAQLFTLALNDVKGDQLLETEFAEARGLTVTREVVRLLHAEVADSRVLRRDPRAQEFANHQWNTQVQLLRLSQFEYFPKDRILSIDTIDLLEPRSILARGVAGDLGAWERFRDRPPESLGNKRVRGRLAREANRFRYRVGQLYVDHGRFLWLDNSEEYEAKLPVRRINLLLQGMSNYPEDPSALLVFNARPGGFSEMHLAGQVNLLESSHWDASLLGYVEGANLIPATPYIARLLGYKILQGQLDAEVNIAIEDNQVDALAKMELEKIKVRRVRDTDHLQVKKSFIPLSLALALLKDGDGDVRFNMPVTGELYDPKFNFSFIFSDLLQRAILESLFAYFTPVGFYSLAKLAWARFRAVHFDDLAFAPGNDTLSAQAKAELEAMVEAMRDNPNARPGICGVSTARDFSVLFPHEAMAVSADRAQRKEFFRDPPRGMREELLRLANRRSRHVQKFLIEAGLDQEDFIQCAPDYIGTDNSAPRVEFSN